MNLYILVEGKRTEKKVYRTWLAHTFPQLSEVSRIEDVISNHYFLISGEGYPKYNERIIAALKDIWNHRFIDHFFIMVDTEEYSPTEKTDELNRIIRGGPYFPNIHMIVHHCCMETWFLGHAKMLRRNPQSKELRDFKDFYDVSQNDPEEMGCPASYLSKSQFHYEYLKAMFREQNLSYSKPFPGCVKERHYLDALVERISSTQHLNSFRQLVEVWRSLGGNI